MANRASRLEAIALLGVLALAAVLRFVQLGHDSLWVDEAFSARIANAGMSSLLDQATSADPNPPLYYVLLHGWIRLFGDSEAALRSLSATVGILLVFVVFKLGQRLGTTRVGLAAALFAAVSEFLVHYSQEARVYSILALLAGASYYFFLSLLDKPSTTSALAYVATTTTLLYAHTYGLFVIAAQWTLVLVAHLWRRDWIPTQAGRRLWLALVAPLVLTIPWFVSFIGHVRAEVGGTNDAKLGWLEAPSLRDLPGTFSGYTGSRSALLVLAIAGLIVALAALRPDGIRSTVRRLANDRSVVLLLIWLAVPILVPFLVSVTVTPIFLFKYTIPAAIAFYLLAALTLDRLGARAGLVAVALVGVALLSATFRYYGDQTENWRGASAYVAGRAAGGDEVVFDSSVGKTAFDYYLPHSDLPHSDLHEIVGSHFAGLTEADLAGVRSAAERTGAIWLVVSHSRDPEGRIPAILAKFREAVAQIDLHGIRITRFE